MDFYFQVYLRFIALIIIYAYLGRPVVVLAHELGHAVAALFLTGQSVRVQLGQGVIQRQRKIGLLQVAIRHNRGVRGALNLIRRPVAVTLAPAIRDASIGRKVVFFLSGPVVTFVIALLFGVIAVASRGLTAHRIAAGYITVVESLLFLTYIYPWRPPRRMMSLEGVGSDGWQVMRLLREARGPGPHAAPVREGFVLFRDHKVWYRIVGREEDPGKASVLLLHGGPGLPHDYLEPLEKLADTGRRVVLYDQLGCGNSDKPQDPSLWTMDLFVQELATVREALALDQVHLWGTAWGGMLALQYALTRPPGLISLSVDGTAASTAEIVSDMRHLLAELSSETEQAILDFDEGVSAQDPAYAEAILTYMRRYVCRLDPWPLCFIQALSKVGAEVNNAMNGPDAFNPIGVLKDWDIWDRLGEINVPTLITVGEYGEVSPQLAQSLQQDIPGATGVVFEASSSTPFLEQEQYYREVLSSFLARVETQQQA